MTQTLNIKVITNALQSLLNEHGMTVTELS